MLKGINHLFGIFKNDDKKNPLNPPILSTQSAPLLTTEVVNPLYRKFIPKEILEDPTNKLLNQILKNLQKPADLKQSNGSNHKAADDRGSCIEADTQFHPNEIAEEKIDSPRNKPDL